MTAFRFPAGVRTVLLNGLIVLGYAVLAKLPALVFSHSSPFWPPAALAVFAAMVWGWRAMPAVFIGSVWVNLSMFDWGLTGALWISLGKVLAPMAGRWGMRRSQIPAARLWQEPVGVAGFLLWMGLVNGLLAGLFGAVGLVLVEGRTPGLFLPTWLGWGVGDACAALMLVPVAHLLWLRRGDGIRWWRLLLRPEGIGAFAFSFFVWGLAFFAPGLSPAIRLGLLGLMLLPAIWSIFRLDQWVTVAHLAAAFVLVLGGTLAGFGPYAGLPIDDAVIGVELLGIAMSASILLAGALQSQRQQAVAELRVLNADLERRAEERARALSRKERSFRDMVESLPAPALITHPETAVVLYANPAARELFGNAGTDLSGISTLAHWVDPAARQTLMDDLRLLRAVRNREFAFRRLDGGIVWVLGSVIQTQFDGQTVLLFSFKDISDRMQREKKLQAEAETDALTGVPNRRFFMAQAMQRIRDMAEQGKSVAFLLFDLDDFKQVNDTRGHACGDLVLQQVARWLNSRKRPRDVFARLGGEEFCFLLPDVNASQAGAIGEAMRRGLDGRTQRCPDGATLPLPSCSVGVASTLPPPESDASAVLAALMRSADTALYQAKSEGKNRVVTEKELPASALEIEHMPAPPDDAPAPCAALPVPLLRALAREVHFGRFFERAAQTAAHLVGADGAAFIQRDGDMLEYRFFHGLPEAHQQQFAAYRFPANEGNAGRVLRERRPLFNPDYAADPQALPAFIQSGLKANLLFPVGAAPHPQAVLAIAWFSQGPQAAPDAAQMEGISLLTELMAGALRREVLERKLRRQASIDPLTQLPNRARLESHLSRAVARARRHHRLLAVGMVDLDDFKPVNDRWGHGAGDALLRELAQRLQASVRDSDFLCRLGGDEFVLVFEDLGKESDLDAVLSRLHAAVESPIALPNGQSARVGMSLGVALYPEDATEPDGLIRFADAALYSCKSRKAERTQWWQRGSVQPAREGASPPAVLRVASYGPQASRLLEMLNPRLGGAILRFVDAFHAGIGQNPDMQSVFDALGETELAHLRQRQGDYLRELLRPDLDEQEHRRRAAGLGRVHALTGVSSAALVESMESFLQQVLMLVQHGPLREADRTGLVQVLTGRIRVELQAQAQAEQDTIDRYAQWLHTLAQALPDFVNWTDFMRWALNEITQLPGIEAAAFGRPDAMGRPVIEFSTPRFDAYASHFMHGDQDDMPSLEAADRLSQASQIRAWRTEQIETTISFARDVRAAPWRTAAEATGFRSAVSIPIRDGHDCMSAILTLYGGLPHQFEATWMQRNLTSLGQLFTRAMVLSHSVQDRTLSARERREWRARLNSEGLVMFVQPVIRLSDGAVRRVEALARLRLQDGQLVSPTEFLPWFGASEITRLFALGLDQSLAVLKEWEQQGVVVNLSINLPPEVLLQPDCTHWVTQALQKAEIDPARLHLEMLETEEFHDARLRDAAVSALSAIGVGLEMDDLGSGYSSLLRLRDLPFHTVKIDQGLVREAHKDPRRVIGFIGSLIRLAHTLDLDVVVEGLESPALVEAAAVLGADSGQGYALAHPMPAADFLAWKRGFALQVDPLRPQTALGALAGHWRWEQGECDVNIGDDEQGRRSCALGRFLQARGLLGAELGHLHGRMHVVAGEQGLQSPAYRALVNRMVPLLMKTDGET